MNNPVMIQKLDLQDNIHHDVLFIAATRSVIGWTAAAHSIRVYFHQGEALILHSKVCAYTNILIYIYTYIISYVHAICMYDILTNIILHSRTGWGRTTIRTTT